jgi:hypothetical protein
MEVIIVILIATNRGASDENSANDLRRKLGQGSGQRREKARNHSLAFTREALRSALKVVRVKELESRHREGYRRKPVKRGEFDWESEQVWGD